MSNDNKPAAAPTKGGQVIGWREVNGMIVFTVKAHSSLLPDQEFVRYDDHLAAVASAADAPGIDLAPARTALTDVYLALSCINAGDEGAIDLSQDALVRLREAISMLDAIPKGGSDWVATDADIAGWVARHDLAGAFGSKTDARCAFEDARSAEQAASAEVQK